MESAYAEHNYSLFSEPIFAVTQNNAIPEINIKQGYQLGAAYLDWFVANFLSGHFWDPMKVFAEAQAAWNMRDYPLICITSADLSGGHCVRPCPSPSMPNPFVETATQCIISVANPNAPGTDGTDAASRIIIDKATNTYSIALANGGPTWTGSHFSGGIMSWVPFSVVCSEPRTPFVEFLALALTAVFIMVGDGATTTQMTDNNGHVLYKPDRAGKATRWDDLATDATRIPGLVRIPQHAGYLSQGPLIANSLQIDPAKPAPPPKGFSPELYRIVGMASPFGNPPTQSEFVSLGQAANAQAPAAAQAAINGAREVVANVANGAAPVFKSPISFQTAGIMTIKHQLYGRGTYTWATSAATSGAEVTVTSNDADELSVERIGAPDQTVALNAVSGNTRTAAMTLRSRMPLSGNAETVFTMQNISVPAGATFKANVQADGKTLQVQNLGDDVSVQLQMTSAGKGTAMKTLQIPAGKTATLSPQDINAMESTPLQVNILATPGGTIEQTRQI